MAGSTSGLFAIRRTVPNDHSCLFWAVAYVAEGPGANGPKKARELREVCAQDALNDPDPDTRALIMGYGSVDEYAVFIRNDFNWGGEAEIVTLAKHYSLEITVVWCESLQAMSYGADNPECKGRVYVLYTGQHYDALTGGTAQDTMPSDERRIFPKGDTSLDKLAIEVARRHNEEATRKAAQRRAKRLKCGGCQAMLSDAEAFAAHCQEVEHDDDFMYDCEEVEVVIEAGQPLPEGTIDLNADDVHTFNNNAMQRLSNLYPDTVIIAGKTFHSVEHYLLCAQFFGHAEEAAASVHAASSTDEALMIANGVPCGQRPDWREVRGALLLEAVRARGEQNSEFATALLGTGDKTVVCVDTNPWVGMQAPGGIASGQNNVGKAMMAVRAELRSKSTAS